jgi:RNA polymerase sigma-70 factor (ECF subfamily)
MDTLIIRAKAREPEALTEIYERYRAGIYRYIYQKVHDTELAEDLTADVFLRMLEGLDRYEDRGWPISAWLYRIAHDRSIDTLRRQGSRSTVPLEPWHRLVSGPEAAVLRKLEYAELWTMLNFLTKDQRSVLELRFWSDLDIRSTAVKMGRTQGAVKALQRRAVSMLNRLSVA